MTVICRKLRQKRHWDGKPWLGPQEAQADAVKCLETSENRLSVFVLDRPEDQTERVVAALALTRDNLAQIDLAIVPVEVLVRCDIQRKRVEGQTSDSGVDGWHEDLVELTVAKIAQLASAIRSEGEVRRYNQKKVETAIQKSLNADYINTEKINRDLVPSLRKRGIIRSDLPEVRRQ